MLFAFHITQHTLGTAPGENGSAQTGLRTAACSVGSACPQELRWEKSPQSNESYDLSFNAQALVSLLLNRGVVPMGYSRADVTSELLIIPEELVQYLPTLQTKANPCNSR